MNKKDLKEAKERINDEKYLVEIGVIDEEKKEQKSVNNAINGQNEETIEISLRDLFDEIYDKHRGIGIRKKRSILLSELAPYFKTEEEAVAFVKENLARKRHNEYAKINRAFRKARLTDFNYFCTFTYDSEKTNEEDFKKRLLKTLQNNATRRGWRYMGSWERGGKTDRLHFHALLHVPEGHMVGELKEVTDYNTEKHCMQTQTLNTYFTERFGRTSFEEILPCELDHSLNYILKYIRKTGEKMVYSRNLYMYFISDVLDEDMLVEMDKENPKQTCRKFALYDKFTCIIDGEIIGEVSAKVIGQMPHSN